MTATVVDYEGIRLALGTNDASAATWLSEFLRPSCSFETDAPSAASLPCVELLADDDEYEAERRRAVSAGEELDCFRTDGGTIRLPIWRQKGVESVFLDTRNRVFYRIDSQGERSQVLTRRNNLAARFAWMRLVRERIIARLLTRGDVVLHGAALATTHGGLVIAGDKGAGKTTLLLNALLQSDASFISNDRAVLRLAPESFVIGMPTVISLRTATLEDHGALLDRLLDSGWDHRLALGEQPAPGARYAFPRRGHPADLSPAQFASLVGAPMASRCPLRAIAFIERPPDAEGTVVRRLAPDEAVTRLSRAVLFGDGREASAVAPAEPDLVARTAVLHAIATRIPVFAWRVGEGGHLQTLAPSIAATMRSGSAA